MATDPLGQPSLLRALADPEGRGEISAGSAASIQQIEANLARCREAGRFAPRSPTTANPQSRRPDSNRGPLHYESVEKTWS
jgi:hypothetical protein